MLFVAGFCLLLLIAVGIWFYYGCSSRNPSPKHREALGEEQLTNSEEMNPQLEQYLNSLETVEAAGILAAKGDLIPSALWEGIRELFEKNGRAGEFAALLADPRPEVRAQAAEVLGYIKFQGSADHLVSALGDKNEEVRLNAGASLVRLGDASTAGPLAHALGEPGKLLPARVAEVLLSLGESAVLPLLEEMGTATPEGQGLICEVLGQLGDARALPALTRLLGSSDSPFVRAAAAEAMGNIPFSGNEELDALMEGLKDEAWEVRSRAAKALGQAGRKEAAAALADTAANDEDWNVRTMAEAALGRVASEDQGGRDG